MATGPGISLKEQRAIYDDACRTHFNLGRAQGRREGLEAGLNHAFLELPGDVSGSWLARIIKFVQSEGRLPGKCPKCRESEAGLYTGLTCDCCGWVRPPGEAPVA